MRSFLLRNFNRVSVAILFILLCLSVSGQTNKDTVSRSDAIWTKGPSLGIGGTFAVVAPGHPENTAQTLNVGKHTHVSGGVIRFRYPSGKGNGGAIIRGEFARSEHEYTQYELDQHPVRVTHHRNEFYRTNILIGYEHIFPLRDDWGFHGGYTWGYRLDHGTKVGFAKAQSFILNFTAGVERAFGDLWLQSEGFFRVVSTSTDYYSHPFSYGFSVRISYGFHSRQETEE